MRCHLAVAVAVALAVIGCDRRAPAPPPSQGPTATAPAATAPAAPPAELVRRPAPTRLVAVGDLHGDLERTRAVLHLAGLLEPKTDRWIGGAAVLVQTGDILDRGDDEPDILALLATLRTQARAAGGDVITLLGNHELMNAAADFRYVTPDGFVDYGGEAGRQRAFAPGSELARHLGESPLYAIVGDAVFSHAGIEPAVAPRLAQLDAQARAWLIGGSGALPGALVEDDSPAWSRRFGRDGDAAVCADAARALASLGVRRMVIGHTPQPAGISAICDDTVWRIDVGLARYYGGPVEALEITAAGARALR
jgi:hypothetical protein